MLIAYPQADCDVALRQCTCGVAERDITVRSRVTVSRRRVSGTYNNTTRERKMLFEKIQNEFLQQTIAFQGHPG